MKKEPNKKAIGLFLVIGFALFVGLIGQAVFHKIHADTKDVVVMYFNESTQGLTEGSSVLFQGVEVGKVTRVVLVADTTNWKFNVAVYARIKKQLDMMSEGSVLTKFWKKENVLGRLIENGMRARLASQSLLTGQLMIELVMLPETKAKFEYPEHDRFEQIPTVASQWEELYRGLNRINIHEALEKINTVTEVLGRELPILLPALTTSAQNLDRTMARVAQSSDVTLSNMNAALSDMSDAAKSAQNLTDYLEMHPEALLKGKKGE